MNHQLKSLQPIQALSLLLPAYIDGFTSRRQRSSSITVFGNMPRVCRRLEKRLYEFAAVYSCCGIRVVWMVGRLGLEPRTT